MLKAMTGSRHWSLYYFDNTDEFKSAQVFHHHFQWNWAIRGGDGIANTLRRAPPVHKIQDFISILTTCSAQSLELQKSECLLSFGSVVSGEVVITKGRHWSFDCRVAPKNYPALALRWRRRLSLSDQLFHVRQKGQCVGASALRYTKEPLHRINQHTLLRQVEACQGISFL